MKLAIVDQSRVQRLRRRTAVNLCPPAVMVGVNDGAMAILQCRQQRSIVESLFTTLSAHLSLVYVKPLSGVGK